MDMSGSSSSSTSSQEHSPALRVQPPPKRPAGRTKFKETRHPVYRGVRRRGSAGRWVCEVRVPGGKRGERLWLGTHATAEAAARAHDAGMLALLGGRPVSASASAARLNFADSAWLLAVPSALADLADVRRAALADLADVRRAALAAVADLQRREAADCVATVPIYEADASSASESSSADDAGSSATSLSSELDGLFEVPAAAALGMGNDMFDFELGMSGEMDLGSYYADLAEGMLLEPPPAAEFTEVCWEDSGADYAALWSYT
ncbi:dehydration-responsive element-binding protein 1H-like [Lolium rigidum]|uniref:dehydration-responsive element-binding protein 1H-like n=1 Tax=Lolium rigidum TaxID=89674 RepID=UPI001F5C46A3|nr:dehydration-responsive element-binding protein 1H-like [Lolium rigidum]